MNLKKILLRALLNLLVKYLQKHPMAIRLNVTTHINNSAIEGKRIDVGIMLQVGNQVIYSKSWGKKIIIESVSGVTEKEIAAYNRYEIDNTLSELIEFTNLAIEQTKKTTL